MAGRPLLRELNRKLEEDFGVDYIFEEIAAGTPLQEIADTLGVSKAYLYTWRDQEGYAEDRKQAWDKAMELSAISKDEEGAKILDDLHERAQIGLLSREEVSLATSRAKYRQWQAEKRSRDYGGQKVDMKVEGTVEHLHLDALRQLGGPVKREELEDGEVVEAELIEETDDDVVHLLKGE